MLNEFLFLFAAVAASCFVIKMYKIVVYRYIDSIDKKWGGYNGKQSFIMEEKKRLLSAVLFLALPFCISSKEIDIPVIKIPSSVLALDWNADSSVFAYSEANSVTIRDADDFSKIKTFSVSEENVQQLKFVANKEKSFEQLVTVSDSSELKIYRLPGIINTITRKFEDNDECRISFSKNGNYIAAVTPENKIHVYLQLYISNALSGLTLKSPASQVAEEQNEGGDKSAEENVEIVSLAFDSLSKNIAALRSDASVVIWNMSSVEPVTVIAGAYTKIPCMEFTEDSEKIIFASAEDTIEIKNFLGETVNKISCEDKINSFRLAEDKKTLIVLTKKNQFRYYALDSAEYLGYIPSWNKTAITSYAFSSDSKKLLVGHEDGSIYILNVKDVFYKPGKKPNLYRVYVAQENVSSGTGYLPAGEGAESSGGTALSSSAEMVQAFRTRNAHSVEVRADCSILSGIYGVQGGLCAGYTNAGVLKPFYFGGLVRAACAFPSQNFPYTYRSGGEVIANPLLTSFSAVVPFGISLFPFASDVDVFAELSAGMSVFSLVQPAGAIFGTYFSPCAGFRVGAAFKRISFFAGLNWDSVTAFSLRFGAGYRFRAGAQ